MIFTASHNDTNQTWKGGCDLEYQEFVEQIRQKVTEQAEEGSKVSVSRILKNNLEPVDGLTILHQGENVARAIWLNPLYQKYEYGIPVERIAEEILEYHKKERQEGVCDLSFYTDFSKVQNHIACKLVHYGMNRTLLEEVPHRAFLDLAVVYYYRVEDERFGNASILVKNDHMRIWHTDPETLHALAMRNTPRLLPYELTDILELIRQISNVDPGMIRQISDVCADECGKKLWRFCHLVSCNPAGRPCASAVRLLCSSEQHS